MILLFIALLAIALGAVALFAWQAWRGLPVDGLPSLIWAVMIVIPFLAQWGLWSDRLAHAGGMLILGTCLLAGDAFATRLALCNGQPDTAGGQAAPAMSRQIGMAVAALGTFSALMALLHMALVPNIPLLHLGDTQVTGQELMEMREEAAKLLHVPALLKYVFNWLVTVFSTIGIVTLLLHRRYRIAAIWYVLALGYAAMTTAKVPAVLLTIAVAAGMVWYIAPRLRKRLYAVAAIAVAAVLLVSATYTVLSTTSRLSLVIRPERRSAVDWEHMRSFADLWRLRLRKGTPRSVNTIEDSRHPLESMLLYRVLLTPVEVANYWYVYYTDVHPKEGWAGILPWATPPDFVHPARKVGLWAYHSRFPDNYSETINAYASADADAYAHFGWPGVIISALLLLALRVSLAAWGPPNGLSRSLAGSAVILFACLVPMGSLQAILVAQGLVFYPAAMWVARRLS